MRGHGDRSPHANAHTLCISQLRNHNNREGVFFFWFFFPGNGLSLYETGKDSLRSSPGGRMKLFTFHIRCGRSLSTEDEAERDAYNARIFASVMSQRATDTGIPIPIP